MRQLIERRIEQTNKNVGPAHDPYDQMTVEIRERYSDTTQSRITLVSCALADGCRLIVDNEILLDFGQVSIEVVEEEFRRLTGISIDRLTKIINHRLDDDPFGGHDPFYGHS